jgi:hypothetical protein
MIYLSRIRVIVVKRIACIVMAVVILMSAVGCNSTEKEENPHQPKNYSKEKDLKILAVGNSFFSTSEVIETFKKILIENGKTDIEVDAIFTTSVKSLYSNTYVDGSGTLPEHIKLREGYYDILVLSTIYTDDDVSIISDLLERFKEIDTDIILFPADNEYVNGVRNAVGYYMLNCANWQGYLNRLRFRYNFTSEHLSINDRYMHTTPVGGLAGACLLYARMFDEAPNAESLKTQFITNYYDLFPGETDMEKEESFKIIVNETLNYLKDHDEIYE